jgi:hypothetical protein
VLLQAAREAAVVELEDALEAAMGWIESFIEANRWRGGFEPPRDGL